MSTQTAYAGGATDKQVLLEAFTVSTGAPYTAGAYDTSGLTIEYRRAGANAAVGITPVTQTVNGAHTDGGFVHISGGRYRLDIPDAAIAAGADYVEIWAYGVSDVYFATARIDIMGADPRAASVTLGTDAIGSDQLAAAAVTEIVNAVWAGATRTLTALDEDSTTIDLDAAIRAALGMSAANLDTQLGDIAADVAAAAIRAAVGLASNDLDTQLAALDTLIDAIKAKTDLMVFDDTDKLRAHAARIAGVNVSVGGSAPASPIGQT